MAVVQRKKGAGVASMRPDDFASGGLPDDFDGIITKVRLVPWDYDGKIDHHVLAVAVDITPDEDSGLEPFRQHYSAGDLDHFVPSMDGETPVNLQSDDPEELEGIYALRVGKREQLNNNSNWAQFISSALEAGFDGNKLEATVDAFEGTRGHFNRIPQQKRSGIQVQNEGKNKNAPTILVLTEVEKGKVKVGAGAGAKTAAAGVKKTAPKTEESEVEEKVGKKTAAGGGSGTGGDLDETIVAAIVEAAASAPERTLSKSKIQTAVMKSVSGADKPKAVKRSTDPAFLGAEGQPWVFDADDMTVFVPEE